ncbi:MAG: hypothetical protein J1F11_03495 [Oscillospiraceae bacterium]|nr:hypothetical protein [Oscillospiraceae bacterium]
MKKLAKRFAAVLAAVMIVQTAGASVYADKASATAGTSTASDAVSSKKAVYKNGWQRGEIGWRYILPDGKAAERDPYKIDGVIYDFSYNGYAIEKYTGWIKENGVSRRYSSGVPYTGWTKNKDGTKKYCLDGYAVTGDHQIGNKIYTFDKDGKYTGKSRTSVLTADCGEKVSSDAEKIRITVTAHDEKGGEYAPGDPYRLERWEKGKWTDCIGKDVKYSRAEIVDIISGLDGQCEPNYSIVTFDPQFYTNNNFKEGYYRFVFSEGKWSGGTFASDSQDFYGMFEVVPPVTIETSEEIYITDSLDTQIETILKFNSEKLGKNYSQYIDDVKIEIMSMTPNGWKALDPDNSKLKPYWSYYCENEILTDMHFVNYISASDTAAGYCKSVVTVDGKKYEKTFRTDGLDVDFWLDEYSLKSEDLTIWFTLSNNTEKDIRDRSEELFEIYEKKDGEWSVVDNPLTVDWVSEEKYLRPGERRAVGFPLGIYFLKDKLKPGRYALNIPGHGFAEFKLTDKEPDYSSMPYAELPETGIEKVTISEYGCGSIDELLHKAEWTGSDGRTAVRYLKQTVIDPKHEAIVDVAGNTPLEINIKYTDGTEETALFCTPDRLSYSDKIVSCGREPYYALWDMMNNDLNDLAVEDIRYEKKTGWFRLDGINRRFKDGLPYTGWLKNKDGTKKYCLDGYAVKGDLQIDGYIYSFGDDGIYTGKKTASPLTAQCGKVSVDTEKIAVTVTLNDKSGKSYGTASPYTMEWWQKGEWVNYTDDEELSEDFTVLLNADKTTDTVYFYPRQICAHAFTDGYYRLTLPVWEDGKRGKESQDIYVVIEAVLPAQVRTSQDVYKIDKGDDIPPVEVWAYIDINSEWLDRKEVIEKITVQIIKGSIDRWGDTVSEASYTEDCDSIDQDGTISFCLNCPPEEGDYIVIAAVGESRYYQTFRIETN